MMGRDDRGQGWVWVGGQAIAGSLALGLVSGCGGGSMVTPEPTTNIKALHGQTPATPASTIYLKGKVGDRAPLLEGTVYELTDATGSIWVLTKAKAPEPGQEVVVKGVVRSQPITLNGQAQKELYLEQE